MAMIDHPYPNNLDVWIEKLNQKEKRLEADIFRLGTWIESWNNLMSTHFSQWGWHTFSFHTSADTFSLSISKWRVDQRLAGKEGRQVCLPLFPRPTPKSTQRTHKFLPQRLKLFAPKSHILQSHHSWHFTKLFLCKNFKTIQLFDANLCMNLNQF